MTTYQLTINTLGICTHFTHGVVSGVPHRVVLPDATQIQSRTLKLADQPPVLYYMVPHFPQLESSGADLTVPDVLRQGDVLMGARVQVINCIDREIEYGEEAPKLTHFDPDYDFSGDVVLHGRAACYFDVYGGRISYEPPPQPGGAGSVRIDMQTDGPPVLLVTPLAQWKGRSRGSHRVTLGQPADPAQPITLNVKNVELKSEHPADEMHGAFDFLLHYLTARGGIPESIAHPTPGMRKDPPSATPDQMAGALGELALALAAASDPAATWPVVAHEDLTPSCSPSQYP